MSFFKIAQQTASVVTGLRETAASVRVTAQSAITGAMPVTDLARMATAAINRAGSTYDEIGALLRKPAGQAFSSQNSGSNLKTIPNPLEQFASVNCLFSIFAVSPTQFNDPNSYRNNNSQFKKIVLSSAGRNDAQRVNFRGGAPEFFIDNFQMEAFITASERTGNSNAIGFKFEVLEPYSAGLFLQTLQLAAIESGATNYLETPYVLQIDFQGFKDNNAAFTSLKPKFYTIQFREIKFDVDEGGSKYQCAAIPVNHTAFSNVVNKAYTDVAVTGTTVKEALCTNEKSLVNVLNQNEATAVKNKTQQYPDIYTIEFPTNYAERVGQSPFRTTSALNRAITSLGASSASSSIGSLSSQLNLEFGDNEISASDFGFSAGGGGQTAFAREGDVYDAETGIVRRNQMVIDPSKRQFQFPQGQQLTRIINQILLSSTFAKEAVTNPRKLSAEGFVTWWKLDAQMELLKFDAIRGTYQKKVKWRVVPYLIHKSVFQNTTTPAVGLDQLEKLIAKQYDYIYTGQNNNVLKFDIKINNMFYTGLNPAAPSATGDAQNTDRRGVQEQRPNTIENASNPDPNAAAQTQAANAGGPRAQRDPDMIFYEGSPVGDLTPEQLVAYNFQKAFEQNSGDLINVDITTVGDTYWLVDSGIGNYFSPPTAGNKLLTQDGTANFEGADVFIYIRIKTPDDINPDTGLYSFQNGGKDSPFSGIYKVTKVTSKFEGGLFTQDLKCIRMPKQALDYDSIVRVPPPTELGMVRVGPPEPPRTSVDESAAETARIQGRLADIQRGVRRGF